MALDFQQIHQQIKKLGQQAPDRWKELEAKRQETFDRFTEFAQQPDMLREKIQRVITLGGKFRCAVPGDELIDVHFKAPAIPERAEIIAADGSQILPDRHAEVLYYLINVGALHYRLGLKQSPQKSTESRLFYDQDLYTDRGTVGAEDISLLRDVREREYLLDIGRQVRALDDCADLVVAMTDGPMELWGSRDAQGKEPSRFKAKLEQYLRALTNLNQLDVIGCGYIDKPRADLVVRMLEIGQLDERQLNRVNQERPYRGVRDEDIFRGLLGAGERSAVFELHSLSADDFTGDLALHFFYLNVGRSGKPWIARVEIPRWVSADRDKIDTLHAVLLQQCAILGNRPFPYLVHRAHEEAIVTFDEKRELTQMIMNELRRNQVPVGQVSQKQGLKDSPRRTRYQR